MLEDEFYEATRADRAAAAAEAMKLQAKEAEERLKREREWAAKYSGEWSEWVRISPLLTQTFDFWTGEEYDFPKFLAEVRRRPSANHRVKRQNARLPFQSGNLRWAKSKARQKPAGDQLDARQAADYLGVGRSTVYEMFNRGELAGFRVRGRVVFDRKALTRFKKDRANVTRKTTPLPVLPVTKAKKTKSKPQPVALSGFAITPPPSLFNSARKSSP